jgi:hypothetical protein
MTSQRAQLLRASDRRKSDTRATFGSRKGRKRIYIGLPVPTLPLHKHFTALLLYLALRLYEAIDISDQKEQVILCIFVL